MKHKQQYGYTMVHGFPTCQLASTWKMVFTNSSISFVRIDGLQYLKKICFNLQKIPRLKWDFIFRVFMRQQKRAFARFCVRFRLRRCINTVDKDNGFANLPVAPEDLRYRCFEMMERVFIRPSILPIISRNSHREDLFIRIKMSLRVFGVLQSNNLET